MVAHAISQVAFEFSRRHEMLGRKKYGPVIEIIGGLPETLERKLSCALSRAAPDALSLVRLNRLRSDIKQPGALRYNVDWAGFSYLYFAANYVKTYLVVNSLSLPEFGRPMTVMDLGCGGGASTAGAISALKDLSPLQALSIGEIIAVDSCVEQLGVFDKVARPWIEEVLPAAKITLMNKDVLNLTETELKRADLILLSYVSKELSANDNLKIRDMLRRSVAGRSCSVVIIESDPAHRGVSVELLDGGNWVVEYNRVVLDLPLLSSLQLPVPPKFSRCVPQNQLVDDYFKAWESHDPGAIKALFAVDAQYEILGSKTLSGLEEILRYWEYNSQRQRNVVTEVKRIMVSENNIFVSWSANFDRIDCEEHRKLDGLFWLTVCDGKIVHLSEAYAQTATPIQARAGA